MHSSLARFVAALPILIGLLVAAGCSDGRPERVPVSGQVLIDGQPLTHGYVRFAPADSRAATGQLDDNGRFMLTCFEPGDGAVTGKHKVTVMAQEPIGQETIKWHAPQKYASPATSGLEQEITGPTDSVKIELSWGGKRGPIVERR
jgi:hypothetical protein